MFGGNIFVLVCLTAPQTIYHCGLFYLKTVFILINIKNLTLRRGSKVLLEQANIILNPGEHIGLIGQNGSGKSTLISLLRGEYHEDQGACDLPDSWRIAHVAQETPALSRSARDYVIDGDTVLRQIEQSIEAARANQDGLAEAQAHTAYADIQGYSAQARADSLLLGLGFKLNQLTEPVASFSGGWRMRLNLAQALMCPADLLLLDEPTNHLDLDAIIWLENWLQSYPGTLIVISHDRAFLDTICHVIVHLHQQQLTRYRGNYSDFEIQLAQKLTLAQSAYLKQQQITHLQKFIDRFKAKASKAKQAQSRVKALEKMQRLARIRAPMEFSFAFSLPEFLPNPALVLEQADCGYQSPILSRVNLTIHSGQRIGLLGANGQGKSTLIKSLVGELPLLHGQHLPAKGLRIGYFAQHQLEILLPDDTPLQYLLRIDPLAREQAVRDFLGGFKFTNEMATSAIGPLSGGEKARLVLAALVWQRPNLLLLDEPTNHLDIETREALTLALAEFDGTLIVVSHDRYLLQATTDQFWLVDQGQVNAYAGDLDDYRQFIFKKIEGAATAPLKPSLASATKTDARILKTQRKTLQNKIDKLEQQLLQLNTNRVTIEAELSNTELYTQANQSVLAQLLIQQKEISTQLESAEELWLSYQAQLEDLDKSV